MFELFVNGLADAVADALRPGEASGEARGARGEARGPVAVFGAPRLARALRDRGVAAVTVGPWSRGLRRAAGAAVCAGDRLPFADGSLAAAVCVGPDAHRDLTELSRVVRAQGTLALITRDDPVEATAAALNAGLLELEQRSAGRTAVVSGQVLGPL